MEGVLRREVYAGDGPDLHISRLHVNITQVRHRKEDKTASKPSLAHARSWQPHMLGGGGAPVQPPVLLVSCRGLPMQCGPTPLAVLRLHVLSANLLPHM